MGVLCNSRCDQRHVYASRGTCYSVLHSGVGGMIAVDTATAVSVHCAWRGGDHPRAFTIVSATAIAELVNPAK